MDELNVTIPVEDYKYLVQMSTEYELLVDGLFAAAKLGYTAEMRVDEEAVSLLLKTFAPNSYKIKLSELKKEKENENE